MGSKMNFKSLDRDSLVRLCTDFDELSKGAISEFGFAAFQKDQTYLRLNYNQPPMPTYYNYPIVNYPVTANSFEAMKPDDKLTVITNALAEIVGAISNKDVARIVTESIKMVNGIRNAVPKVDKYNV